MNDLPVLLRALADRLSDSIIVAAESGLVYVNPRGMTLLGTDRSEEVIGKPLSRFLRPGTISEILKEAESRRAEGGAGIIPGNLLRLDGRLEEVGLSSLPLMWEGMPSCLLIVVQGAPLSDIASPTPARSYLNDSSKIETLSMLAAGIAHEFNNSLTAVLGFSQLALMQLPAASNAHRQIQHVIAACRKSSALIHQVLMFRRQNGEARQSVALHVLVKELLPLLRSAIPSWIELRERIATTTSFIEADPVRIRQMLAHLVVEAVHAMRLAGGVLIIEVQDEEFSSDQSTPGGRITAGRYACVRITDSGVGREQGVPARFLDPSGSAGGAEKEQRTGLSLVDDIASAYRGTVQVESQTGIGTRVTVLFPTVRVQSSPVSPEEQVPRQSQDLSTSILPQ